MNSGQNPCNKVLWWAQSMILDTEPDILDLFGSSETQKSSIIYTGLLGQSSHWPSVWWSKHHFDRLKINQWAAGIDLGHSKIFIFIFVKLKKIKRINWKDFCKEFCKKLWKRIILGTWEACLMRQLSQQPSVLYWILSDFRVQEFLINYNSVETQMCMFCVELIKSPQDLYTMTDTGCSNTMDFTFG